MKYNSMTSVVLFIAFFLSTSFTFAQDSGNSNRPSQVGAFLGRVLPNGIEGAEEIFSLWGLRYSHPLGKKSGYLDFGTLLGNSDGVQWKGAFAGISMHIPIETLIGHAGIGIDFTQYESETTAATSSGGGHFIGGVMSQIGGNAFARFDMKLNSKPGTSLYFALGLLFELDGLGAGEGN